MKQPMKVKVKYVQGHVYKIIDLRNLIENLSSLLFTIFRYN